MLEDGSVEGADEQDLKVFLDRIFALDQSDSERSKAFECYELLKTREGDFLGSPLELDYWNALSLELFHMGQFEALQNGNVVLAKSFFTESFVAAKKVPNLEWTAYVEGTLRYFENNLPALNLLLSAAGDNGRVLECLLVGLQSRGSVDYAADYLNRS